jgi:hypothetical protein
MTYRMATNFFFIAIRIRLTLKLGVNYCLHIDGRMCTKIRIYIILTDYNNKSEIFISNVYP